MKYFLALFLLFGSFSLRASNYLRLRGEWHSVTNCALSEMQITGGEIVNESTNITSGSLMLKVYLTDEEYSGGSISGLVPFEASFEPLEPGHLYRNIDIKKPFKYVIEEGSYFMTLVLLDHVDGQYVIADYQNFSGKTTITENHLPEARLSLIGNWSASVENQNDGIVTVTGDAIENAVGCAASDSLMLGVYLSKDHYDKYVLHDNLLGVKHYGYLQSGSEISDIDVDLNFLYKPDAGEYYITIILFERLPNGHYRAVTNFELGTIKFD